MKEAISERYYLYRQTYQLGTETGKEHKLSNSQTIVTDNLFHTPARASNVPATFSLPYPHSLFG